MESKKARNTKVTTQSGRNYKPTQTVILKGQWLNEMGFEIGDRIKVECENEKLVISLDREKMELLDAERSFHGGGDQKSCRLGSKRRKRKSCLSSAWQGKEPETGGEAYSGA